MIISSMTMMEKLGKNFQSHPGLRHASTSLTAHTAACTYRHQQPGVMATA